MKLELKHISGYLPYGLKFESIVGFKKSIRTIFSIDTKYDWVNGNPCYTLNNIKPILRPMSDLYKEIDGVVHIVELAKIHDYTNKWELKGNHVVQRGFNNYTFTYDGDFHCTDSCECMTVNNQLDLFNYLFEHHFDIFGLIDKNLAIDINSLSQ